jgi:hypothetical protein
MFLKLETIYTLRALEAKCKIKTEWKFITRSVLMTLTQIKNTLRETLTYGRKTDFFYLSVNDKTFTYQNTNLNFLITFQNAIIL